jgi:hypothetical protein
MLPWIIVGWMRAIVGTFIFIALFALPLESFEQLLLFVTHCIYYGERYFGNKICQLSSILTFQAMTFYYLKVVCRIYKHMDLIANINIPLVDPEKLP